MYTVGPYPPVSQGFLQVCGRLHTVNSRTPSSRVRGSGRERVRESRSREERKEATRRAIIAAALKLLQDRSFSSLSLREVTREVGIVPAAFYRHFESMEALGLVLIDESFRSLRDTHRVRSTADFKGSFPFPATRRATASPRGSSDSTGGEGARKRSRRSGSSLFRGSRPSGRASASLRRTEPSVPRSAEP